MNEDQQGTRPDGDGHSFERRLDQARRSHGMVSEENKSPDRGDMSGLGLMLRAGTEMVAALGVGVGIGLGLDRWLGTRAVFLILFVFLGAGAGVLNVWRLVMPSSTTEE